MKSKEEAIEWVKRCPNPMPGESEIEIRKILDVSDWGELTPELEKMKERRENFAKRANT